MCWNKSTETPPRLKTTAALPLPLPQCQPPQENPQRPPPRVHASMGRSQHNVRAAYNVLFCSESGGQMEEIQLEKQIRAMWTFVR